MSNRIFAILVRGRHSWNRLPEAIQPFSVLYSQSFDVSVVDFTSPSSPHAYPFTGIPGLFHYTEEFARLYPALNTVNEILGQAGCSKPSIHYAVELAVKLSHSILLPVLTIYADDDEADIAAIAEGGKLISLQEFRRYGDLILEEGKLTFQELLFEEEPDIAEEFQHIKKKIQTLLLETGFALHFPEPIPFSSDLHRIARSKANAYLGRAPELLHLGSFEDYDSDLKSEWHRPSP